MLVPYLADCQLLRALAVALDLPPPCTASALSLLHRVKACAPPGGPPQLTPQELVSACIFVAAKIEEVNVSANHLINSARLLSHPSQRHLLHALAPLNASLLQQQQQQQQQGAGEAEGTPPAAAAAAAAAAQDTSHEQQPQLQSSRRAQAAGANATHHQQQQQQRDRQGEPPDLAKQGRLASQQQLEQQQQQQQQNPEQQPKEQQAPPAVVVGDDYYAAKDCLFTAEQVVLRLTSFQLAAEQPHKHLLNFCRLLGASRAAAAAAVCLLNDALGYTGLCLTTATPVLAAAALQAAFELLLQQQRGQQDGGQQQTKQEHQQGGRPRGEADGSEAAAAEALSFSIKASHQGRGPQQQRPTQQHWQRQPNGRRSEAAAMPSGGVCSQAAAGAVADGSWVALVGLSQQEVDAVWRPLLQLLAAAPAPEEDLADAAAPAAGAS